MIRTQDLYDVRDAVSNALVKLDVTNVVINVLRKTYGDVIGLTFLRSCFYEDKVFQDVINSLENAHNIMCEMIFERTQEENIPINTEDDIPF